MAHPVPSVWAHSLEPYFGHLDTWDGTLYQTLGIAQYIKPLEWHTI